MGEKIKLSLRKQDRLCNIKLIDGVFKAPEYSIKAFPLIFTYNLLNTKELSFQVIFSVPKRKFNRAVDRNQIKRLIRECFRLKKPLFQSALDKSLYGAFIYTHKELVDYQTIQKSISKIVSKLNEAHRD